MTEKELRDKIGIGPNDLFSTNLGMIDIFGVKDGKISYGFLASGNVMTESIESFMSKATATEETCTTSE